MVTADRSHIAGIILSVGLLCFGDLSAGQAHQAASFSVQVAHKRLVIGQGKERLIVDLSKVVEAYELNEAKLLYANSDGKLHYFVAYVSGPSGSPIAAMSCCGAGTEGYLFRLAFDNLWRLQKRQSVLIESCFESAEGSYEIKANRLTATWDNYRLEKHFTLEYDSRSPERGFHITETKIESGK